MADREESQAALFKSLQRKQRKHERLLGKLEMTTARLERRKVKFQALEASIADLERRLSEPRKEHLGQEAASDGALKHAQLIFNPSSGRDDHQGLMAPSGMSPRSSLAAPPCSASFRSAP